MKQFKIKLKRSTIGCTKRQRDAIRCIGLKWREHTVTVKDSPAMRGNIMLVQHMVEVTPG